jgi:single-stranded-DNA-specific exonuclease
MARSKASVWETIGRRPELEQLLAARLGMHPVAAAALVAAGITSPSEADIYLSSDIEALRDPLEIQGMGEAVDMVRRAAEGRERILVHGDFDADGICATALLIRTLCHIGCNVRYYLPDRMSEGYGVSERAVRQAAAEGISLIITADCGITAHQEVALAKRLGCNVIVFDHHDPEPDLPEADVIVAPRLPYWEYECSEMPASALALRFAQAVRRRMGHVALRPEELVDLAAVGVVADVAPMCGENRVIVRAGLDRLPNTSLPGLRALQDIASVREPIRAYDIGYRIGPRINAVGRLADAGDALDLLLTENEDHARRLALHLDRKNRERQNIQERIYREAVEMLVREPKFLELPVIVLSSSSESWHVGVVGIVASKVVEEFGRPTVLLVEEDGVARGSARSVAGFHITEALRACGQLVIECGGHAMAAGLRARVEDVARLREALAEQATWQGFTELQVESRIRAIPVDIEELDHTLPRDLARLEPFGPGSPEPLFVLEDIEVVETRYVGRGNAHLKLFLTDGRRTVGAIGFRMGDRQPPKVSEHIDVCFVPSLDTYWGRPELELWVKDWRKTPLAALPRRQNKRL